MTEDKSINSRQCMEQQRPTPIAKDSIASDVNVIKTRYIAANHRGISSINSIAPSRPTVMIMSPKVLVANPASQYVK
jgi:hypothetical protein